MKQEYNFLWIHNLLKAFAIENAGFKVSIIQTFLG